jgi:hypothetical protein
VNPNFNAQGNVAANANVRFPRLFIQPQLLNPGVFHSKHLNAQIFYSKCDVTLDLQRVDGSENMDQCWWQWQEIHRLFTTDLVRKQRYGASYKYISNTAEMEARPAVQAVQAADAQPYVPGQPLYRHPNLIEAQNAFTYDTVGKAPGSMVSTLSLSFDGVFPLYAGSNQLRAINRVRNTSSYLHPGATVDITLHQRPDLKCMIERLIENNDNVYWQVVAPGGQPAAIPPEAADANYSVEIHGISLWYHSIILEDPRLVEKIMGSTISYPVDAICPKLNELSPGVMESSCEVALPRGTRLIAICFYHEIQLMQNAVANGWMSPRMRIPPGLDSVQLSLTGKAGIIMQNGIRQLQRPRNSHSLREYHAELCRQGLYDKPFDDFCPPARGGIGFNFCILADVSPYHKSLSEIAYMTALLKYTEPSQPRWRMRTFCLVQRVFSWNSREHWMWKDVI